MDAMNILSSVMQDPEAMKKAMAIAGMLSSSGALDGVMKNVSGEASSNSDKSEENASVTANIGEISPKIPSANAGGKVSMNQRLALLSAIKPYLSPDKAKKLDSIIGILKLIGTIEENGLKLF